jgi:NADH-quinone oxidoreductase subunit L
VATLTFIGLTYLWAGESFTHFLYPAHGLADAYFQAAAWHQGLFDSFVAIAALAVIAVWIILYGKAHGVTWQLPDWLEQVQTILYVTFLNGLYVEDVLRAMNPFSDRPKISYRHRTSH